MKNATQEHKVVISCAITGSVHTPSMSPYLPITPEEIADSALAAVEAGAAIVHLHTRDPVDGSPVQDVKLYERIVSRIRNKSDAVINITTGGPVKGATIQERMAPVAAVKPDICTLHLGSLNLGLYPLAEKERTWKHEWERRYLLNTRDVVFTNTFSNIEYMLETAYANGALPEFECFDVGHLYTLKHFKDRGLVKKKIFMQYVMGLLGGIGADNENLIFMRQVSAKLFGDEFGFSVIGAGRLQMPMNACSVGLGGHVRVGLEDSLYSGRGRLAESNAEQVRTVKAIVENLGFNAASVGETRALLGLRAG